MLATGYDGIMDEFMSKRSINVRALARAVENILYGCFRDCCLHHWELIVHSVSLVISSILDAIDPFSAHFKFGNYGGNANGIAMQVL